MRFATPRTVLAAISMWLLAATAHGAATLYSFSATGTMGQFPEFLGSAISGTFMYDPAAIQTFTTTSGQNPANASGYGGHLLPSGPYSSYTALSATVSGVGPLSSSFSFSDPRGSTIVSNGGFTDTFTGQVVDMLAMDADPFGPTGIHNIVPFSFGNYTLWNMRMFWIEGQANPGIVPDLLNDQNLPSVLPDFQGRLALDFIPAGSTTGSPLSFVFFTDLRVAPASSVPEPGSIALLGVAFLVGLGASRRKRTPNIN